MAIAGFCNQCGANVYLDANWSCPRGHGWNAISGWYDTDTGQQVTPPWLQQAAAPQQPTYTPPATPVAPQQPAYVAPAAVPAAPLPEPVPEPAPAPDPAVTLRQLIRGRLEGLNLAITEKDGVYSASRGDEYECSVAVDGTNGRIVLWERLRTGRDPGVRDAVRALAGTSWAVKIVLKRDDVAG